MMKPLLTEPQMIDAPYVDSESTGLTLPQPLTWAELLQPVDCTDNLLGNRFLERGQGLILYGPAGCGRSVAGLQAVTEWAAGLNGLHLVPFGPLKTVVLQTEDSMNDARESLAGILSASCFTSDKLALVEQNLVVLPPVPGGTGRDLEQLISAAAIAHSPDLVLVNPLLAFCPGDPTRELGGLLYQTVDRIIKLHHLGFIGIHHTPKTNNRDTSGYGVHDYQYLAAGDARVANWPRAMIQIEPVANGVYRFRAAKRWQRTGWTWNGNPTNARYFRHSRDRICWIETTAEDASEAQAAEKYERILSVLPAAGETGISRDRVREQARSELHIGKNRADSWLRLAIEDGSAERVETPCQNNRRT